MSIQGYDAFGHPSPTAVGRGHFVCQYLKNVTRAQIDAYHAAGVIVVLIYETTGKRSLGGLPAGQADAHSAVLLAQALGAPANVAIYFAEDDFDVTAAESPTVVSYMKGVQGVLGTRTGFYGGLRAVAAVANARVATFLWQTYAWSGGVWDKRVALEQYLNGQNLAGTGVDYDRAVGVYGGWAPPAPVAVPPKPPLPVPAGATYGKYYESPSPALKPPWPVDVSGSILATRVWSGHCWRKIALIVGHRTPPWAVDIPPRGSTVRQWDGRKWDYHAA